MKELDFKGCLTRKLQLIQSICDNNERQRRFLQRRNMKGLQRLLAERGCLIAELVAVDNKLSQFGDNWQQPAGWQAIAQTVEQLQSAMIGSCKQVADEANAERRRVAAELRSIKEARQLQDHYAPLWTGMTAGSCLSVRG